MLAVIGLNKNARCRERELQAAVADELPRQQVTRIDHVCEAEPHAANLETKERGDVTVHLHVGFPLAQMSRVEVNPVVVLEHDFPLLSTGLARIDHVGRIIIVQSMIEPTVGLGTEIQHRRIVNRRVVDAPSMAKDDSLPMILGVRTVHFDSHLA